MINDQIYITSIYNAVERARLSGRIDLKTLQLFNLYRYYIGFTDSIIATGDTTFNDWNILLKKEVAKFKYKYSNEICNYKNVSINTPGLTSEDISNIAPTVSDYGVNVLDGDSWTFDTENFVINFADPNNDSYKFLIVYPTGLTEGDLYFNGVVITEPIVINLKEYGFTEPLPLVYTRTNTEAFTDDTFTFRVSDDNVNYLYSSTYNMAVSADVAASKNQPATLGDSTIYVDNREVTVFTLANFTSGLTPPYNDPEGDLIDAIRISEISTANQGVFKFNNIPIIEGQIITREDINAGLFIHEASNTNAITSDVFEFDARDEGSGIWVN